MTKTPILVEYKPYGPIQLPESTVVELKRVVPSIAISPVPGKGYTLTPGSIVGAVMVEDIAFNIRPKFAIRNLLFLLSFAMKPDDWEDVGFVFREEHSVVEAIIPGFVHQVRRALARGVLHGYVSKEEALNTLRGRIRIDEQLRRRYGRLPPIEVAYDDYTPDIEVNRLIKAALAKLRKLQIKNGKARSSLQSFDVALAEVSPVGYDGRPLPDVLFDRLNSHYEPAVMLAKLILSSKPSMAR